MPGCAQFYNLSTPHLSPARECFFSPARLTLKGGVIGRDQSEVVGLWYPLHRMTCSGRSHSSVRVFLSGLGGQLANVSTAWVVLWTHGAGLGVGLQQVAWNLNNGTGGMELQILRLLRVCNASLPLVLLLPRTLRPQLTVCMAKVVVF